MNKFLRLILTTAPEANWIAAFAIALLVPKLLWWNRLSELFSGAKEIGLVWEAILISILASYIFYFFVVHLKEFNDKDTVRPAINLRLQRVYGRCAMQLHEIAKATNATFDLDDVTEEQIDGAFSQINPNADAPMVVGIEGRHLNWPEYFNNFVHETKLVISKILEHPGYLEPRLVRALVDIENSSHFAFTESVVLYSRNGMRNTDLSVFSKQYWKYVELCRVVKNIADKHYG